MPASCLPKSLPCLFFTLSLLVSSLLYAQEEQETSTLSSFSKHLQDQGFAFEKPTKSNLYPLNCQVPYRLAKNPLDISALAPGYQLESDQISIDATRQLVLKPKIHSSGNILFADKLERERSGESSLAGEVFFYNTKLITQATEISHKFEGESEKMRISQGKSLSFDKGLHFWYDQAIYSRNLQETLAMQQVQLTTCTPEEIAWSLQASSLDYNLKTNQIKAYNPIFKIHSLPIFYLPYLSFYADSKRHSGFLQPSFHLLDEESYIVTPYYFNLHPQFDATLYPVISTSSSVSQLEVEARYLGEVAGENILEFSEDSQGGRFAQLKQSGRYKSLTTRLQLADFTKDKLKTSYTNFSPQTAYKHILNSLNLDYALSKTAKLSLYALHRNFYEQPSPSSYYHALPRLQFTSSGDFAATQLKLELAHYKYALKQYAGFSKQNYPDTFFIASSSRAFESIERSYLLMNNDLATDFGETHKLGLQTQLNARHYRFNEQNETQQNLQLIDFAYKAYAKLQFSSGKLQFQQEIFYKSLHPDTTGELSPGGTRMPLIDSYYLTPSMSNLTRISSYAGHDWLGGGQSLGALLSLSYLKEGWKQSFKLAIEQNHNKDEYLLNPSNATEEFHQSNDFSPLMLDYSLKAGEHSKLNIFANYDTQEEKIQTQGLVLQSHLPKNSSFLPLAGVKLGYQEVENPINKNTSQLNDYAILLPLRNLLFFMNQQDQFSSTASNDILKQTKSFGLELDQNCCFRLRMFYATSNQRDLRTNTLTDQSPAELSLEIQIPQLGGESRGKLHRELRTRFPQFYSPYEN